MQQCAYFSYGGATLSPTTIHLYQQAGIKHARQAYNAKVNDHFDSLKRNNGDRSREEPPAPVDQIGSIAHERASRHVADIREFVAGER